VELVVLVALAEEVLVRLAVLVALEQQTLVAVAVEQSVINNPET
jgi:hypothetical protein